MIYLDLALRGGAATVLLLLGALLWRAPIGWEGRASVAAVAVAQSAFLMTTSAIELDLHPVVWANMRVLASLAPAAITWLIVTIFLDAPGRRWPWILVGLATSLALYTRGMFPGSASICLVIAVGLYGALLVLSLWSARDDLVECRCRARPVFAAAIAGLALFLSASEALGLMDQGSVLMALLHSGGTLGIAIAFAVWLLRPDAARWPGETEPVLDVPRVVAPMDGVDAALIARIRTAMGSGIWREEGLTIGALAQRLSVPEHRVRRAINQGLGHRNFSNFINRARINAACDILRDPARMHVTVLEIAYDVGFASVGPFNRAFRAVIGQSPTEYRRIALSEPCTDSDNTSPIAANLH